MSFEVNEARTRAVADPNSAYYNRLCQLLEENQSRHKEAMDKRVDVSIPFMVPTALLAELEKKFGWRVSATDHGLRSRVPVEVAALAFCMSMQSLLTLGSGGEETIWIDGDLPTVCAKQMGYVHVCRTHASNSLEATYQMEDVQIQKFAVSRSKTLSAAASAIIVGMRQGTSLRVCSSAARCRQRAESVVVDHLKTPASLAQVVATARAHGCSAARGWFFFQPEMLLVDEGPTQAFPGTFRVDRQRDRVVFIPESAADSAFVQPFSDLLSFVKNHEYVDATGRWLVEKHGVGDGVVRYAVTRVDLQFAFPEELGLSYPIADACKWVEIRYPTRVRNGQMTSRWHRSSVRLPKSTYEKTMGTLLTMEASQLSWETVVTVARNHNSMVVVGGNTVRKPERVWSDILARAAGPMLAQAVVRREATSAVLRAGLAAVRKRNSVVNAGWLCLAFEAAKTALGAVTGLSAVALVGDALCDLSSEALATAGLDCVTEECVDSIEVVQEAGLASGDKRDYGALRSWLPGVASRAPVIARAMAFYAAYKKSKAEVEVVVKPPESVADSSSDGEHTLVEVVSEEVDTSETPPMTDGSKRKLLDHLIATQDVACMGRIPRAVERFETLDRVDAVRVPVPDGVEAAAQEEYDTYFPGVSTEDAEMKACMATVSDVSTSVSISMSINDAKRAVPKPRQMMRSKWRAGAPGRLPRYQGGFLAAVDKRNGNAVETRGMVDFSRDPLAAVNKMVDVAFRSDWRELLARELDNGMWIPNEEDMALHVPKLDSAKCERMLQEWFTTSDIQMTSWLAMTKATSKPPVDPGAAAKVPLPQTILYNESSTTNTMYSAMLGHVHKALDAMMKPQFKLNLRGAPAEFERWFNSLQPVRQSVERVYAYEGDSYNYDSSLELMAASVVLCLYRKLGFDGVLYEKYKQIYGVKRAASLMYGVLMRFANQGVSGVFDTLFRNGLVTFVAVIETVGLPASQIVSLAVTGDDYLLETAVPVQTGAVVEGLALKFNLSAKFFAVEHMYFCSRYFVRVDGWWYWVADPFKKYEKACSALTVGKAGQDVVRDLHDSLQVDCRHYDDYRVLEALCHAVANRMEKADKPPYAIVQTLAGWCASYDRFRAQRLPATTVGLV